MTGYKQYNTKAPSQVQTAAFCGTDIESRPYFYGLVSSLHVTQSPGTFLQPPSASLAPPWLITKRCTMVHELDWGLAAVIYHGDAECGNR